MTTAADVLRVAEAEAGYVEGGGTGHNGNITKYWDDLDDPLQGQSWCAVFVSWVFREAGLPLPAMDRPYGFMNCNSGVHYAKAHGLFDDSGHYAPGDIIFYGPNGGQHTGIVISDDGVTMRIYEGNTSPDEGGSQWDGGGVYKRTRPHGPWVYGVMKTSRLLAPEAPKPTPAPKPASAIPNLPKAPAKDPYVATKVSALQKAVRVGADGQWGSVTNTALLAVRAFAYAGLRSPASWVKRVQTACGATPDGIPGPKTLAAVTATVKAIQAALGVTKDGAWGPKTDAAFLAAQRRYDVY